MIDQHTLECNLARRIWDCTCGEQNCVALKKLKFCCGITVHTCTETKYNIIEVTCMYTASHKTIGIKIYKYRGK